MPVARMLLMAWCWHYIDITCDVTNILLYKPAEWRTSHEKKIDKMARNGSALLPSQTLPWRFIQYLFICQHATAISHFRIRLPPPPISRYSNGSMMLMGFEKNNNKYTYMVRVRVICE